MTNPFDQFDAAPRFRDLPPLQWAVLFRLLRATIVLALVPRLLRLLPES